MAGHRGVRCIAGGAAVRKRAPRYKFRGHGCSSREAWLSRIFAVWLHSFASGIHHFCDASRMPESREGEKNSGFLGSPSTLSSQPQRENRFCLSLSAFRQTWCRDIERYLEDGRSLKSLSGVATAPNCFGRGSSFPLGLQKQSGGPRSARACCRFSGKKTCASPQRNAH